MLIIRIARYRWGWEATCVRRDADGCGLWTRWQTEGEAKAWAAAHEALHGVHRVTETGCTCGQWTPSAAFPSLPALFREHLAPMLDHDHYPTYEGMNELPILSGGSTCRWPDCATVTPSEPADLIEWEAYLTTHQPVDNPVGNPVDGLWTTPESVSSARHQCPAETDTSVRLNYHRCPAEPTPVSGLN